MSRLSKIKGGILNYTRNAMVMEDGVIVYMA